jgi:NADP-dependent 3-hydroxy acid dehydrogenase YdfG/acyl carrier protein
MSASGLQGWAARAAGLRRLQRKPAGAEWLYAPGWRPRPLDLGPAACPAGRWIVLGGEEPLPAELLETLRRQHSGLCALRAGQPLPALVPGEPLRLVVLNSLREQEAGISRAERLARSLADYGGLLALARDLALRKPTEARILVLTNGLAGGLGSARALPEKAILLGPDRVIPQELPGSSCRIVDVVPDEWAGRQERLVALIEAELACADGAPWTVWRGGRRWTESFEALDPAVAGTAPRLREGGVYLITGGLGEIGLHLARWLAARFRARLILTGRRDLEREARESDCALRRVRAIEALGTEVLVARADVADEALMRRVFAQVIRRFGRVDGVFHAAGVGGATLFRGLADSTPEHTRTMFRAKVEGLQALAATLPEEVDFCLLFSSLSTVLGGVGRADYAAANSYLDAFAAASSRERPGRWLSVDWDVWVSPELMAAREGAAAAWADLAITPAEGLRVLAEILAAPPLDRVVVSTSDLAERIGFQARGQAPGPAAAIAETLRGIWRDLLDAEEIADGDDFFDLGGDSLLALQMGRLLRRSLGVDLSIEALSQAPTLTGLAARIESLGRPERLTPGGQGEVH